MSVVDNSPTNNDNNNMETNTLTSGDNDNDNNSHSCNNESTFLESINSRYNDNNSNNATCSEPLLLRLQYWSRGASNSSTRNKSRALLAKSLKTAGNTHRFQEYFLNNNNSTATNKDRYNIDG